MILISIDTGGTFENELCNVIEKVKKKMWRIRLFYKGLFWSIMIKLHQRSYIHGFI